LCARTLAELRADRIEIDLYRRNLRCACVGLLAGFLDNPTEDSDLPALARSELSKLSREAGTVLGRSADAMVRAHLEDLKTRADHALDPIPPGPGPQRSPLGLPARRGGDVED
jgi:hypothetical protein